MSSITATATDKLATATGSARGVLIPYVVGIVAQLPLLLIYFSSLWDRPHYQFFPFALLIVGVFAYLRWPKGQLDPFFASSFSNFLFWLAVVFGLLGTIFVEGWFTGWFTAVSVVLLLTSLFARTRDSEFPSRSLLAVSLPLFSVIMLPNNFDYRLITWLQLISARLSSGWLDLMGFRHFSPGTTLNFPDQAYEVERACSGVQSFFTLLFCATFIIVTLRRGFFRGLFLMVSAVVWAILMNSVRIMLIPVAWEWFGLDLKSGIMHEILGYLVMLFACLMLLSTDQLIEYLFGNRDAEAIDGRRPLFPFRLNPAVSSEVVREPLLPRQRIALKIGAVLLCLFGVSQLVDVIRSLTSSQYAVRFFDSSRIVDVGSEALPETLKSVSGEKTVEWKKRKYERIDRNRGSDLGQRSDIWQYLLEQSMLQAMVSLDQPFPGWHELVTCYRINGWEIDVPRRRGSEKLQLENGETIDWTYVEVGLRHSETSQRGWLMFGFCDESGIPFEAPVEWDDIRYLFEGIKNRLSSRIRSNLFRGQSYQIQVFLVSASDFDEPTKEEIRSQFFEARKHLREAIIKNARLE